MWDRQLRGMGDLGQLKAYFTTKKGIFGLELMSENLLSEYSTSNIVF